MPTSNDTCVRQDGFWKIKASTFPAKASLNLSGVFLICCVRLKISVSWALVKSFIEIKDSKSIIKNHVRQNINLFAYPNGTEEDYNDEHIKHLKANDFICAVTTTPKLNKTNDNLFRLGRFCIGSDFSSNPDYFALNISGCISVLSKLKILYNNK